MPAVLVGGAIMLWITLGVTLAQVTPATTVGFWRFAAQPRALAANRLLAGSLSPATARAARTAAGQVLLREPINVAAARAAGLATGVAGDEKGSVRLLRYAESLSRHDLGTQAALIEIAVARGDIPEALHHYDVALRTSDTADQLLMPILVPASRQPAVAGPLRTMLLRRPPWRMRFIYSLLTARPWAPTFMPLLLAAQLDVREPLERDFLVRASRGLVASGALSAAAQLYQSATGTAPGQGVRNGNFAAEDSIPPLDWDIVDEPGLSATKGPVDGAPANSGSARSALSLNVDPGRSGAVARQLILLPPGRYRLNFRVGSVDPASDRSSISVTCTGASQPIVTQRFPPTATSRTALAAFVVPAGCSSQWLVIQGETDLDASAPTTPWIGDIAIARDRG